MTFYSAADLAERWGLSKMSIFRLIQGGQLDAINVSLNATRGKWRVSQEAVDRFERSRSTVLVDDDKPKRRRTRKPAGKRYV